MKIKETYNIEAKANAFVVRNYAFPFNESAMRRNSDCAHYLNLMCLMNGCEPLDPDKDPIVELWWQSKELGSDDLQQAIIPFQDKNIVINFHYLQHVPLKVLQKVGAQEGMACGIKIPIMDVTGMDRTSINLTLMTLFQQSGTRYADGTPTFEDAIAWVTRKDVPWAPLPPEAPKKEFKCGIPAGYHLPPELEAFLLRTNFTGDVKDFGNGMYVLVIGGPN